MGHYSQASFSARLSRAKQLYQFIENFNGYAPDLESLSPAEFLLLIKAMEITQSEHTVMHHLFAEAAKERAKIFASNPDSLSKKATLMKAYVKGKFKKDSQQFADVETLVNKIRGEKPIKTSEESDAQTISRSEKSYGSQLENFNDLVTLAIQFGSAYTPANETIKLVKMQDSANAAAAINNATTVKFGAFKPKIAQRKSGFQLLSETANSIKEMVKSQYGVDSEEYKLIRGLNFSV